MSKGRTSVMTKEYRAAYKSDAEAAASKDAQKLGRDGWYQVAAIWDGGGSAIDGVKFVVTLGFSALRYKGTLRVTYKRD